MVEASIPDDRLKIRTFNGSLISFKALVCFPPQICRIQKKKRFYLVSLFEHIIIFRNTTQR